MSNVIINADLSQAELRAMAVFSGDKWMQEALQEGAADFFDTMMRGHFGDVPVEHWYDNAPGMYKEIRTKFKGVVYGLSFGRQAPAIAKAIGSPLNEAKGIINGLFELAPDFYRWREEIQEAAITPSKRDMLINPFGRRFQSEVITPRNYQNIQREALSFLPQSTSSDICLATAIRVHPKLQEIGYKIINVVHDAIMIEGPEDGADLVGNFVRVQFASTGRAVLGDAVPFLSEFSYGRSWGDID